MAKQVKKAVSGVVNVVKSVVKAVGSIVSGVVKAVGKVVSAVVNFVASPFMGLFGTPDAPSDQAEAARQQGVLIQQEGSNVNIPVVYGYRKIAGTVVFAETGSTNNQYLWVAYVMAEGLVEGIREIYIDDNVLPADTAGRLNAGQIVDITDTTSKYAGRVKLQWFPGVYHNTASSTGIAAASICKDAPSWKPTMHYNGLAVLFARYEWKQISTQTDADNNPFGGGIPQVQVCLMGRRVASLADSTSQNYTYGGTGYTERYSYNPAEILLDYLRNPRYGKGLTNSEIDWDSFRIAAAKCNTQVQYVTGISGPILTCHYVVDTGQTIFNNVKILLSNMRGYLPYVQGKYKLKIEDAGNPTDITSGSAYIVAAFTNDGRSTATWTTGTRNIMGDITYTGIERSAKYNQVVVSYVDPDQKWSVQQVVYPETETERQYYIGIDGGRENKAEITFPAITNYAIAKDYAKMIFNKSRLQDSCSFIGDSSCFDLEPGDNIYIDSKILRFGTEPTGTPAAVQTQTKAIPWRIVSIKLNNDYTFDISCVRNPDSVYPYTRVGEIDQVLPTYVPKGAQIYFPGTVRTPPVGLVTPNSAPWDTTGGTGGTTTNPPVVNPGGGGTVTTVTGVGSISGTTLTVTSVTGTIQIGMYIAGGTTLSNTQITAFLSGTVGGVGTYRVDKSQTVSSTSLTFSLTANTTNPVVVPPAPAALDTVINVNRISYALEGGNLMATLQFQQPSHAMYAGAIFYFRRLTETFYKSVTSTDTPGAGQTVTVKIGPFDTNYQHEVVIRVRYSTGESSTRISRFQFVPAAFNPAADPTETIEVVAAGWTINTTPPPNARDTTMKAFLETSCTTILNSGLPYSPRRMSFTVTQETEFGAKRNYYIKGLNIYYKQSAKSVWKKAVYNFNQGYAEGTALTFTTQDTTPIINLGAAYNTVLPATNPGATQQYDFIMRFSYVDDTESLFQMRAMQRYVEYSGLGLLLFNPFYGAGGVGTGALTYNERVSDWVATLPNGFIVQDTAAPGYVENALNISIDITGIYGAPGGTTTKQMQVIFTPPPLENRAEWAGLRVITINSGAAYSTRVSRDYTMSQITYNSQSNTWYIFVNYDFYTSKEFVIIPLVYTAASGTTAVEANNAFYGAGQIFYNNSNWLQYLNVQKLTNVDEPSADPPTAGTARAKLGTASPTVYRDPKIDSTTGVPYKVAGVDQDPRDMTFTITPTAVSYVDNPVTTNSLVGVNVYYKPTGFAYYRKASYTFGSPLTPGTTSTSWRASQMTPVMDLGSPVVITPFTLGPAYDMVFRLLLSDGTESGWQVAGSYNVQTTGGGTGPGTANTAISLYENAPPGTIEDPREFNITVRNTSTYTASQNYLTFYIDELTAQQRTYVNGVKIRYRKVELGSNSYSTWNSTTITQDPVYGSYIRVGSITAPLLASAEYEVVLTPIVTYDSVRQEANNSWYGRGVLNNLMDLFTGMNLQRMLTATALGNISATVVQSSSSYYIQVPQGGWTMRSTATPNSYNQDARTYYTQLQFSYGHITGFYGIDLYRREVQMSSGSTAAPVISPGGTGQAPKYHGAGRWEFVGTVTTATHPPVNGIITVNMRMPPTWNEFNLYYGNTVYDSSKDYFRAGVFSNDISLSNGSTGCEYIAIVRTGGSGATYSTKVTCLPRFPNNAYSGTVFTNNALYPLINNGDPAYVKDLSALNSLDPGTQRNVTIKKAQFTGSIASTTLTVTAVASGTIETGMLLSNAVQGQLTKNTLYTSGGRVTTLRITGQLTGTTGGAGTYSLNESATVSSTTLYGRDGGRDRLANADIRSPGQNLSANNGGAVTYTPPGIAGI